MRPPFELREVADLIVPASRSTTGRALASAARRFLFEQVKAVTTGEAGKVIEASVATRLPGSPHAISSALEAPTISTPLRAGLRGSPELLLEGALRLAATLGDRAHPIPPALGQHGPLPVLVDPVVHAATGTVMWDGDPGALVRALPQGYARLSDASPAQAEEARRHLRGAVVGRLPDTSDAIPALGLAFFEPPFDENTVARSIVEAVVRTKLSILAELRSLGPEARDLEPAAMAAATRAAFGLPVSRHEVSSRAARAFPDVYAELAALSARAG